MVPVTTLDPDLMPGGYLPASRSLRMSGKQT